jgi:hypothetical protein
MKYFQVYVHGYLDFFMFDGTNYHMPEFLKNKPIWMKTIIAEDRIQKMKEVITNDQIFDYISTNIKIDPLRVKISEYKQSVMPLSK